jgi:hypothetical protein
LENKKMPLPLLAIPVIHSSGAWIASTAAGGYLAGTLSSTWLGAFVLGNSTWLGSLGLVSAAGIAGSTLTGGLAAAGATIAATTGSALSAVGLGGLASYLGIAPVATFLGVTPVGWAIIGSVSTVMGSVVCLKMRSGIKAINEERVKGGLNPTTWKEILRDVMNLESESILSIINMLANESSNLVISKDRKYVFINGHQYKLNRLKYVINECGAEELQFIPRFGAAKTVFTIKNGLD